MNKFQKKSIKERILKLSRLKSTGPPAELAFRLEISERSVKRFVKEIREEGTDIRYCQAIVSYVICENIQQYVV
jgi:biotin operon repressor